MSQPIAAVVIGGYGLVDVLLVFVVVVAACAIAWVILTKAMGVVVPAWLIQVFWILVAVFVFVIAVKLLLSLL